MPVKMIALFVLMITLFAQVADAAGLSEASLPRRGQLYKVTLDGKTSYLFGTSMSARMAFTRSMRKLRVRCSTPRRW